MKKTILITTVVLMISVVSFAQNYKETDQGVTAHTQSINIEISFYSPSIVRVLKYPEGIKCNKQSLSVIMKPEPVALNISTGKGTVCLSSDSLSVELNLQTGRVFFASSSSKPLFTEKDYGTQFITINDAGKSSYEVRQAFMLDKDEVIFGLGQQQRGRMNQRDQKLFLRNTNTKICIPFIHSVKGYGVFWDNYSPTTFIDNPQEMSFDSEVGGCSDYYFMYGYTADGVIACMRNLTGQAPMFPLWTLGFWQSRERYKSQQELLNVLHKYRELKVPLDGIIQDWQYWGPNKNWNSMNFDNPKFSDPLAMIADVHKNHAHIMISIWPDFGPETKQYQIMSSKGMLLNFDTWPLNSGVRPYDPFNPEAREIYWNFLKKGLVNKGIDAWWLDSTEPDHLNIKDEDFDQPTYLGSFRRVHNAYPLMTNKGVYDHLRQNSNDKRVFLMTRSAFAGQQHYGSSCWSGDLISNWDVFRKQISAGLNFSLCGIPYWNTDIGGFFAWQYGNDVKNKAYQELYVRWFEFGTFTPIMRSHNSSPVAVEIYQFGKKGDWAFDAQEKFIKLRYRFLPYIYTEAWNITHHSSSLFRQLMMDFIHDKKVYNIDDEYMFGHSILVKVITEPMYVKSSGEHHENYKEDFSTVRMTSVYLPAGADWWDFWNNKKISGDQTIKREVPIDVTPLYIKAGSIVPFGPDVQYAEERNWDNLEIRIYPGHDCVYTFYEDQNDNYNYEKGVYSTITFHWNDMKRQLTIDACKGVFPEMLKIRNFKIVLVNSESGIGNQPLKAGKIISYRGVRKVVKF
ncbi:MAG: DUF5110 domain-containing protein [Bacteroidaceae bacterium]|nr:DUF5110 domain-containing protein [Bacteroidaceae bacterium]